MRRCIPWIAILMLLFLTPAVHAQRAARGRAAAGRGAAARGARGRGNSPATSPASTQAAADTQPVSTMTQAEIDSLLALVTDETQSGSTRANSIDRLGLAGMDKDHIAEILEKLLADNKNDLRIRNACVTALGQLAIARSVPALVPVFQGADLQLAHASGEALARIRPAGIDALADCFKNGTDGQRDMIKNMIAADVSKIDENLGPRLLDVAQDKQASWQTRTAALNTYLLRRTASYDAALMDVFIALVRDTKRADPGSKEDTKRFDSPMTDADWELQFHWMAFTGLRSKLPYGLEPAQLLAKSLALLQSKEADLRIIGLAGIENTKTREASVMAEVFKVAGSDLDRKTRNNALDVLNKIDPDLAAKARAANMLADLSDPLAPPEARRDAIGYLETLPIIPVATLPELVACLRASDVASRHEAAHALGKMGHDAASAVPALVSARNDPDTTVRDQVQEALAMIGPPEKIDLAALQAALNAPDSAQRLTAIKSLGNAGFAAAPAAPALAVVAHGDGPAAFAAAEALTRIEDAIGLKAGQGNGQPIKTTAAAGEALHGPVAAERLKALEFIQRQANPEATRALLADIVAALHDPHREVRSVSADILGMQGIVGKDKIPVLLPLLDDWSKEVRDAASRSLLGTDRADARLVAAEIQMLKSNSAIERSLGAEMLRETGKGGVNALPALQIVIDHDANSVARENADLALHAIMDAAGIAPPIDERLK